MDLITTNEKEFLKEIDVAFITTPHNTHYNFLKALNIYANMG